MVKERLKRIPDAEVNFYEDLYSTRREQNDNRESLKNIHLHHRLFEETAYVYEGPITLKECIEVVHGIKLNTSPCLDGLTVDFFNFFY